MKRLTKSRALLWLVLALPGAWIAWRWIATPDAYGFGHAIADSGDWAAWLLLVTLAVTPIRLASRKSRWAIWLVRRRRDLGVASFVYAAGHTAIYLGNKLSPAAVLAEWTRPDILAGWLAFALFVPLAATSNDIAARALKRSWKTLHRLVYPAAVLAFMHWILTAFNPTTAWIHVGILVGVEGVRLGLQMRQRVT